jgi:hypothetical protein
MKGRPIGFSFTQNSHKTPPTCRPSFVRALMSDPVETSDFVLFLRAIHHHAFATISGATLSVPGRSRVMTTISYTAEARPPMRSTIILVVISLAGASLVESRGGGSQDVARQGSGQPLVRITAQQLSEAPPTYAFLVTNLANTPISSIVIGRRELTFAISGVAPNVPVRMESPRTGRPPRVRGREAQPHLSLGDGGPVEADYAAAIGRRLSHHAARRKEGSRPSDIRSVPFAVKIERWRCSSESGGRRPTSM